MGLEQITGPNNVPTTVLLNTLAPNGVASVGDTTSLTQGYARYEFYLENVTPSVNNSILQMRIATSGSNFVSGGYVSMVTVDGGGNGANAIVSDTNTAVLLLSGTRSTTTVGNSTVYGVNGVVRMIDPASTVPRKAINGTVNYLNDTTSGTAAFCVVQIGGYYDGNSNPVTGVNFSCNSGNIATGLIRIYGIR